jgi:hypothetical protein
MPLSGVVSQAELDDLIAWSIATEKPAIHHQANAYADALLDSRTLPNVSSSRRMAAALSPPLPRSAFPAVLLPGWRPGRKHGAEGLAEGLRYAIELGKIPPGAMLPKADEIAARYAVTRRTVLRAARQLCAGGLLVQRGAPRSEGAKRLYVARAGDMEFACGQCGTIATLREQCCDRLMIAQAA